MLRPFFRKLENFSALSAAEQRLLEGAVSGRSRYETRQDLVVEGERSTLLGIVTSGFLCRYKALPDGRRQILGYLIPGDICDSRMLIFERSGYGVRAATPSELAIINRPDFEALLERRPDLLRAVWWTTLVEESVAREWQINLGKRTAIERLAHLLCELLERFRAVGLATGNAYPLPVTQDDLADMLGLSSVHTNRTLQALRRRRLIKLVGKELEVLDPGQLQALAMFDPSYLHLKGVKAMRPMSASGRFRPSPARSFSF